MQVILLITTIFLIVLSIILIVLLHKTMMNKPEIINTKPIEVAEIDKIKILLQKDGVETINNAIDTLIKQAVDRYMILNVNFNSEPYMTEKIIDELSKYTLGTVKSSMTTTVRSMIGILYKIDTDEELEEFLKLRIKIYILALSVKTNQTIE